MEHNELWSIIIIIIIIALMQGIYNYIKAV